MKNFIAFCIIATLTLLSCGDDEPIISPMFKDDSNIVIPYKVGNIWIYEHFLENSLVNTTTVSLIRQFQADYKDETVTLNEFKTTGKGIFGLHYQFVYRDAIYKAILNKDSSINSAEILLPYKYNGESTVLLDSLELQVINSKFTYEGKQANVIRFEQNHINFDVSYYKLGVGLVENQSRHKSGRFRYDTIYRKLVYFHLK